MTKKNNNNDKSAHPIAQISLADIAISPFNYRYGDETVNEDSLQELANSIKTHGVIQPVLVRCLRQNKYELVVGERRYRSSILAKQKTISAVVRELTDDQVKEIQLIENLHREDPHPMMEANAIKKLMELPHIKGNVDETARRLGRSKTFVYQRLKLSELNGYFQPMFQRNIITTKQAMKIALLDQDTQLDLFNEYCLDWENEGWAFHNLDYLIQGYQLDLTEAPFDITDVKLDKKAGPCTGCQYNTAAAISLFPEMESDARCLNKTCYDNKCRLTAKLKIMFSLKQYPDLPIATMDESVLTGYFAENDKLIKGREVLVDDVDYGYLTNVPEMPNREDFNDYEEEEDNEEEYRSALDNYNEELQELEETVAAGKTRKAILIDENDFGTIVYLHPKPEPGQVPSNSYNYASQNIEFKAKDYQEAVKAKTVTVEMIESEKQRLLKREERSKELDEEKLQEAFYEALEKSNALKEIDTPAGHNDHAALVFLVYESLSYTGRYAVEKLFFPDKNEEEDYYEKLIRFFFEVNESQISVLMRIAMLDNSSAKNPVALRGKMLRLVVEQTPGLNADILVIAQRQKREEREEKLSEKLSQLKRQAERLQVKKDNGTLTEQIEPAA